MNEAATEPRTWPALAAPLIVLVGAIALLQVHAIAFWMDHVGPLGWAWSLLLETVALWLWYQPRLPRRLLGMIASLLVLLGPVHHVSEPLIEDVWTAPHAEQGRQAEIDQLREERERLQANLATFRANSEERTGWLPAIEQAEDRLQAVEQRLSELVGQAPETGLLWREKAVIAMQATALVLFQITAILAITTIARRRREQPAPDPAPVPLSADAAPDRALAHDRQAPEPAPEPTRPPAREEVAPAPTVPEPEPSAPTEATPDPEEADDPYAKGRFSGADIRRLRERLDGHLEATGRSQAAVARDTGLSPRDLSFLRRHEERVEAGERTISEEALERLASVIEEL